MRGLRTLSWPLTSLLSSLPLVAPGVRCAVATGQGLSGRDCPFLQRLPAVCKVERAVTRTPVQKGRYLLKSSRDSPSSGSSVKLGPVRTWGWLLAVVVTVLACAGNAAAITPNDPSWARAWGQRTVNMPAAWDISKGDPSVVIAVVDTGVDPATPDLKNALVDGWDFIANGPTRVDPGGHGTLGATIVAGRGNDGQGVAGYCWLCRVMPIRVSADGNAFDPYPAALGIRWAVDHGARIISLAFSDEGASTIAEPAGRRGDCLCVSAGRAGAGVCGEHRRHRASRIRRPIPEPLRWPAPIPTTRCPRGRRVGRGWPSRRLVVRWGSGPGTA